MIWSFDLRNKKAVFLAKEGNFYIIVINEKIRMKAHKHSCFDQMSYGMTFFFFEVL